MQPYSKRSCAKILAPRNRRICDINPNLSPHVLFYIVTSPLKNHDWLLGVVSNKVIMVIYLHNMYTYIHVYMQKGSYPGKNRLEEYFGLKDILDKKNNIC